jgi:hypothetical protein
MSLNIITKTYKIPKFSSYFTESLTGLCGTPGFHRTQFENYWNNGYKL